VTTPNTHWNAEVYDRIGTPMRGWAQAVIDDLGLRGDETVVDAGCGSGSVTFDLLERLPSGRIFAVDNSAEMIDKLSETIAERGETRIMPILASLTDFKIPEPADVVFSNATLHWIQDDANLFRCLFAATKPGGRFRAQCGGAHIFSKLMPAAITVRMREPFVQHLGDYRDAKNYRSPERAVELMETAGFTDARSSAFDAPVEFEVEDEAALYLRTIILRDHVANLPEDLGDPYVRAVIREYIDRNGSPFTADYVRLNLWASRPT
jgi:trans-aconitate 2-methyltransferase